MTGSRRIHVAEAPAARQAAVVSCWMCGTRLNSEQMVPDGTGACDDVRWYCQDTAACTERWTSARNQAPPAGVASPVSPLAAPITETAKPDAPGSAAPPPMPAQ
jgi:hypothetical protein